MFDRNRSVLVQLNSRCFICCKCKRPQDDKLQVFVGDDKKIYCSNHYPKQTPLSLEVDTTKIMAKEGHGCPKCGGMVFDAEKMTVKAGTFHKHCFNCNSCGQSLNYSNFTSHEKSVYCHGCFRKNFDTRSKSVGPPDVTSIKGSASENCAKCGGIVFGPEKVQTKHHVFHKSCLSCQLCAKSLLPSNFFETDDKVVCELCLASLRRRARSLGPSTLASIRPGAGDSQCLECGYKVFQMERISTGSGSYHLSCYKCNKCKCLLDSATANLGQNGRVFCNGCFAKSKSIPDENNNFIKSHVETTSIPASEDDPDMCVRCWGKVFLVERRVARSGVYHARCFTCEDCSRALDSATLMDSPGAILCRHCHDIQAATARASGCGDSDVTSIKPSKLIHIDTIFKFSTF